MTFQPYGNITYDNITEELSKDNVIDSHRLMLIKDKILQCSYYDEGLDMYVLVCDNGRDGSNSTTAPTVVFSPMKISCAVTDDDCLLHCKISTDVKTITYNSMDVKYYVLPIILSKHEINYHMYNVNKDNAEIMLSFEEPIKMGDPAVSGNRFYNSIHHRSLLFCTIPLCDFDIVTPISGINTLNKLVEHIHKISRGPCFTVNNRFGPIIYKEYNGTYYNAYHWVKYCKTPKKEEKRFHSWFF